MKHKGKIRLIILLVALNTLFLCSFVSEAAGDSIQNAIPITTGTTYTGSITNEQTSTWYSFHLNTSGRVVFTEAFFVDFIRFYIYDGNGHQVRYSYGNWDSNTKMGSYTEVIDLTSGDYYLAVVRGSDWDKSLGEFRFFMNYYPADESFNETLDGSNNTFETASPISLNKSYKGQIAANDNTDYYKVNVPAAGTMKIEVTSNIRWAFMYVYDKNRTQLVRRYITFDDTTKTSKDVFVVDVTAGINYFCIVQTNDSKNLYTNGNYNLKITTIVPGWHKTSSGKFWYQYADGTKPKSTFATINNKKYYFDANGYRVKGWKLIKNEWYYFNSNGVLATGWTKIGSKYYYLSSEGKCCYGWHYEGNNAYYLKKDGSMAVGWLKIDGYYFYFKASGARATGWLYYGKKYYYMDSYGRMQTGWQYYSGDYYYLNSSGAMVTGWQKIDRKWYYFKASGARVTGWKKLSGKWYYFNYNGQMRTDKLYENGKYYYFNSDGTCRNP